MEDKPIDDFKRKQLVAALKKTNGNRTLAAERLQVSVRTVRNWIKRYDLSLNFPPLRGRQT